MAHVHYSMSGEGRGHAARAQVVAELLRERHRVVLHASGQAYEMLSQWYRGREVEVRPLPGLRFHYRPEGSVDRFGSFVRAMPFVAAIPARSLGLARTIAREKVDLVISDFEPLLPRAAALAQIPSMSVDHQQFLLAYDLSGLPPKLKRKAEFLAPFTRAFYHRPRRSVVSAFFFPPLSLPGRPITQAGVLMRGEVLVQTPHVGPYLVAYIRRNAHPQVLHALSRSGVPVRVYGLGARPSQGSTTFSEIHPGRFVDDLAGAAGLVTTAGNQLIGEALYLRKPVLAYPEPGNFEQHINAHFLEQSRAGWAHEAHSFSTNLVRTFVDALPVLRDRIRPERINGNQITLAAIEEELHHSSLSLATQPRLHGQLVSPRIASRRVLSERTHP